MQLSLKHEIYKVKYRSQCHFSWSAIFYHSVYDRKLKIQRTWSITKLSFWNKKTKMSVFKPLRLDFHVENSFFKLKTELLTSKPDSSSYQFCDSRLNSTQKKTLWFKAKLSTIYRKYLRKCLQTITIFGCLQSFLKTLRKFFARDHVFACLQIIKRIKS